MTLINCLQLCPILFIHTDNFFFFKGIYSLAAALCSIFSLPFLRFTEPLIRTVISLVKTRISKVLLGLFLVMALAGLSSPLIHRILSIFFASYDLRNAMISIIRRFLAVVPSLVIALYSKYESVQKIRGIFGMHFPTVFSNALIIY